MTQIRLPHSLHARLLEELARAGSREIGGILMGEQLAPGDFRIVDLTVQTKGGRFATFDRAVKAAWSALGHFFDRTDHEYTRFNYLGEWHSHPSFAVTPSGADCETMHELVEDADVGATFAVLLIVKLTGETLEASSTLFLPEGTSEAAELDFEVPIE